MSEFRLTPDDPAERSRRRAAMLKRINQESDVARETQAGMGPSDTRNLGGFKVFTCEKCGDQYRSKERHGRECKEEP